MYLSKASRSECVTTFLISSSGKVATYMYLGKVQYFYSLHDKSEAKMKSYNSSELVAELKVTANAGANEKILLQKRNCI